MSSSRSATVSLQELIALNDEILALVRAKLPLPSTLRAVARDMPGRAGKVLDRIGQDLEAGQSLDQALANQQPALPSVYVAVVTAGLKVGRLPAALESIATSAQYVSDVRRTINTAMLYPVLVVSLAYAAFLGFLLVIAKPMFDTFRSFRLPKLMLTPVLESLQASAWVWWWIPPVVLLAILQMWYHTSRANILDSSWNSSMLLSLPGIGRIVRNLQLAAFSQLLVTLLHSNVPLAESLRLAGRASGKHLQNASERLASHLENGQPLDSSDSVGKVGFPPLLAWSLAAGQQLGAIEDTLSHAADTYRYRAIRAVDQLQLFLPTVMLLFLGVTAILIIAFLVYYPVIMFWHGISEPFLS